MGPVAEISVPGKEGLGPFFSVKLPKIHDRNQVSVAGKTGGKETGKLTTLTPISSHNWSYGHLMHSGWNHLMNAKRLAFPAFSMPPAEVYSLHQS